MAVREVEQLDAICIIGSNLRKEVPLLAHRVRKAALAGANISFVNTETYEYFFDINQYLLADDLVAELQGLLAGATGQGEASETHRKTVDALKAAESTAIFIGHIGGRHPRFAELRALASQLAQAVDAKLGFVTEGANAAGLSLAGVLPHRTVGGQVLATGGTTASQIVQQPKKGLVLFGAEPAFDCANGQAGIDAMTAADFVIAMTPFMNESLSQHADVILPVGTFAETSGTFVNAAGDWQSFGGVAMPLGASRPGWKVLRVLGNLLELANCEYQSSEDIRDELLQAAGETQPVNQFALPGNLEAPRSDAHSNGDVPMYQIDALVRRSESLQLTVEGHASTLATEDSRKIA